MQYLTFLYGSIRKRGLLSTLQLLLPEVLFDLRFGTDTFRLAPIEELGDAASTNRAYAVDYQGVNPWLFNATFRRLRRSFERDVMVDFGSGKGRALLLAAELGFGEAIGVEFSAQLCEVARENVRLYRRKRPENRTSIELVHGDVLDYAIPDETNVFFFFNPFHEPVLGGVIARVVESLRRKPREHFVVYLNPADPEALERHGLHVVDRLLSGARAQREDAIVYQGQFGPAGH